MLALFSHKTDHATILYLGIKCYNGLLNIIFCNATEPPNSVVFKAPERMQAS